MRSTNNKNKAIDSNQIENEQHLYLNENMKDANNESDHLHKNIELHKLEKSKTEDKLTREITTKKSIIDINNEKRPSSKPYDFFINNIAENKIKKHKNNNIDTTKYNFITFLPKALIFQFMRLANIYFLIIAIIQSIPSISPLNSSTAIVPLVFVLCVSLIREAIEDVARYRYDKISNKEKVRKYQNGKWILSTSEKLEIGDIVIVEDEKTFPADFILLDSSQDEGICYIETATLDGEKTLKFKKSHAVISDKFKKKIGKNNNNNENIYSSSNNRDLETDKVLYRPSSNMNGNEIDNNSISVKKSEYIENFSISGFVVCDKPSDLLYKLDGNMTLNFQNKNEPKSDFLNASLPLDAKQLLLKGSILKNTEWVIGIVVYTGHSTKLMLNSKKGRVKYSSVEKIMSRYLISILILQSIFCIICGVLYSIYYKLNLEDNAFLEVFSKNLIIDSLLKYFTYLLLLNTMIPISLIITLEITKIIQGYFMVLDIKMYSKVRQKFAKTGSVSLNEELGQVDYIFSDKTGTLTCNKMKFKFCVIADVCYEFIRDEDLRKIEDLQQNVLSKKEKDDLMRQVQFREQNEIKEMKPHHLNTLKNNVENSHLLNKSIYSNFVIKSFSSNSSNYESKNLVLDTNLKIHEEFFKGLALNNDCVVNKKKGHLEYSGLSPDDIELVGASSSIGCSLLKSQSTREKKLNLYNEEKTFEILNVIEFTSDRKKSSIIVREGEYIKLYVKGADSEMFPIMSSDSNPEFKKQVSQFVDLFSKLGYRTLIVGMKIFEEEEYKILNERLFEINKIVGKEKVGLLDDIYKELEKNIYCLGATVVEDKLQDLVPETIRDLRFAGIKIWMLTGDKIDTAENIGKSCNLISEELQLFKVTNQPHFTFDNFLHKFEEYLNKKGLSFDDFKHTISLKSNKIIRLPEYSILIDLKETKADFLDSNKKNKFIEISKYAKSVICSRCSPGQKSEIVAMIKRSEESLITLSIGDGGNDVPMITEANIGIGVYGEEGMMAVQSSDYAIGEFKFLRRLLLFHGRTNYVRISEMILYFFFKNFVFTITHLYFGFYNNFTGQTIIDDWFISLYNMIFTAFPLGARAVTDFDLHSNDGKAATLFQPFLYEENKRNPVFTLKRFCLELLRGMIHCLINYFGLYFVLLNTPVDSNGHIADIWYFSVNCYTNIIFIVSLNLLIKSKYMTWINWAVIIVLSWVLYFVFLIWVHYSNFFQSNAIMSIAFSSSSLYLTFILIIGLTGGIDYFFYAWDMNFNKTTLNILLKLRNEKGKLENYRDFPSELNPYIKKLEQFEKNNNNNAGKTHINGLENFGAELIEVELANEPNKNVAISNSNPSAILKERIKAVNINNRNPDQDEGIYKSKTHMGNNH